LDTDDLKFVIVTIHGTFASGAEWPNPDSRFCSWLGEELQRGGATDIRIEDHRWSGANSDADRVAGSEALRTRLARIRREHPGHATFLIGHSHGGNVALHALNHSPEDRASVAGVVTLATPFLLWNEEPTMFARAARALTDLRSTALILAPVAVIALLVLPLVHWLFPWFYDLKFAMQQQGASWRLGLCKQLFDDATCRAMLDQTLLILGMATGGALTMGFGWGAWQGAKKVVEEDTQEAERAIEPFRYVQPPERLGSVPILVLWSVVDEALQVVNCSWWLHRAALWALRIWVLLAITTGIVALYGGLWWVYDGYNTEMARAVPSSQAILWHGIAAMVALPVGHLAAASVGWFFRGVVRMPVPLHGNRSSLANLHWTPTAKRVPFYRGNVTRIGYGPFALFMAAPGLIHSTLYGSRLPSPDIARWMVGIATSGAVRPTAP
jgi:pimeloyl-ACP methyl ester carboxylesterase